MRYTIKNRWFEALKGELLGRAYMTVLEDDNEPIDTHVFDHLGNAMVKSRVVHAMGFALEGGSNG